MHAYAILAHKNLDQLPRLVRRLNTGQASFFLHIDKKADIAPYEQELGDLGRMPNVEFVKRYHSPWAAFGIIKAQRATMQRALRTNPRFTHLTLLTGQDYPIRAPQESDALFEAHRGTLKSAKYFLRETLPCPMKGFASIGSYLSVMFATVSLRGEATVVRSQGDKNV